MKIYEARLGFMENISNQYREKWNFLPDIFVQHKFNGIR
jgi:hypothetical protein